MYINIIHSERYSQRDGRRVCPRMGIKYLNPNMAILMGNMMINHGLFVGQNSSWDVDSQLWPHTGHFGRGSTYIN